MKLLENFNYKVQSPFFLCLFNSLLVGIMMAKKNARKSIHTISKFKRMEKMRQIEKALEGPECSCKVERMMALEDLEYYADIADPLLHSECDYNDFMEAGKLLRKIIKKKLKQKGNGLLSEPKDIYDQLDLRELKMKHPNEGYTHRAKNLDIIEKRFKLHNFFLENAYENYFGSEERLTQRLVEDKPVLDEIYSGMDVPITSIQGGMDEFYMRAYHKAPKEKKSVDQVLLNSKNEELRQLEKVQ
ncbi:hypothetical protein QJS04_geneDACA008012 [Acorus gramineus]|uniref:Uncharacterized protein n=1 Tax=Acorus gramineus TaxID=55184 RepID=A0AAV9B7V2_ACOGR|nr:hypothetical protein QJS04_geneDACA008012 [Acorus gramineus]